MHDLNDTIAAIATSNGEGGIAIVRISGGEALSVTKGMFFPQNPKACFEHAHMLYGFVRDEKGNDIDEVMAVWFQAPRSYTRQDVCEIHTHGGISAERVLQRAIDLGVRPAERGEFTYRAFMNGRLSLDRAEAVMSLISAGSEKSARSSLRELSGGVSAQIGAFKKQIMDLVTLIDAAADFPDEIDQNVTNQTVRREAQNILERIKKAADPSYAHLINDGASVVIAGKPNVGKSSIMNRLLGADRAIVTDIAGTTRDIINESISINGLKLTLSDTAGIRASSRTKDTVELIGIDRARKSMEEADIVVLVLDASGDISAEDEELLRKKDERFIVVANKDDVRTQAIPDAIRVSARTGDGIDTLKNRIYEMASPGENDGKLMNLRHIALAQKAANALERMISLPKDTYLDLLRQDLTEALEHLGEITGENVSESVIDSIFERFCVGK